MATKPSQRVLSDQVVIHLRRITHAGAGDTYDAYAAQYNTTKNVVGKAMRGDTFAHLNSIVPPVRKVVPKEQRRETVRHLFRSGKNHAEIVKQLKMSKTTVEILTKDISQERRDVWADKREKARSLFMEGNLTVAAIAREVDASASIVLKWCKDLKDKRTKIPKLVRPRQVRAQLAPAPYGGHYLYFYCLNGENRVRLIHTQTKKSMTMTLYKYNMSIHLGRLLTNDDFIVKLEGDSDELSNLRLLTKREHRQYLGIEVERTCRSCGCSFEPRNRTQVLCSDTCRSKEVGERFRGQNKKGKQYKRKCVVCDEVFYSTYARAEICRSTACLDVIKQHNESEEYAR